MASVTQSYRIRAYPNGAQRRMLDGWFGAVRWLWNTALEIRSAAYRVLGLRLNSNDISRWLTQWKRTAGHEWLQDVPATALTQALLDQERAFRNFFGVKKDGTKRETKAGYPQPRSRWGRKSLRFQDIGKRWEQGTLSLPKLGPVKLAESLPRVAGEAEDRPFVAIPGMVTLSRDALGRYHVSFTVVTEVAPLPATGRTCGVDLGVTNLATIAWSDGTVETVEAPRHYFARRRYLRRQKRKLSRRIGARKGEPKSARYLKQKVTVAKAEAQVAAQRANSLHELTTGLMRRADLIGIEDLNVKAMGRGILSASLHDAAFGEFRRQTEYKAGWYGRTVVKVDRFFPSSKRCCNPECGHIHEGLKLGDRVWTCTKCGTKHLRDPNAAFNIHAEALRVVAGRDVRQEPLGESAEGMCVDGRGAATGGLPPVTVLPDEARSGQSTGVCLEHTPVD
jgi:putative transposase